MNELAPAEHVRATQTYSSLALFVHEQVDHNKRTASVIGLHFEGTPEGHKYGHRTGTRLILCPKRQLQFLRYRGPTASPTAIVGAILPL
jgi:hypothetical protein